MPELDSSGSAPQFEKRATVSAGDYFNKLTGERVERECRERLQSGCRELVLDFGKTEIVNSVGISILLGVIDSARGNGATVTLTGVNSPTIELFNMLGVTKHVEIA
jgi:anti-anti-sigma factor